jgi:hypothetical protein
MCSVSASHPPQRPSGDIVSSSPLSRSEQMELLRKQQKQIAQKRYAPNKLEGIVEGIDNNNNK